jgi:hypothetical protein
MMAETKKFELIELFGQTALFANERLKPEDIPDDMYLYHIRGSDDGRSFSALEEYVLVNHSGSIVTKVPIELGKDKIIVLTDENAPNFIGESVTFGQYLNYAFEPPEEPQNSEMIEQGGIELT